LELGLIVRPVYLRDKAIGGVGWKSAAGWPSVQVKDDCIPLCQLSKAGVGHIVIMPDAAIKNIGLQREGGSVVANPHIYIVLGTGDAPKPKDSGLRIIDSCGIYKRRIHPPHRWPRSPGSCRVMRL
jgi:hypothetical protein